MFCVGESDDNSVCCLYLFIFSWIKSSKIFYHTHGTEKRLKEKTLFKIRNKIVKKTKTNKSKK